MPSYIKKLLLSQDGARLIFAEATLVPSRLLVPAAFFFLLITAFAADTQQQTLAIQEKIQSGDLAAASALVDAALASSPRDGGLHNLRGIIHAESNQLEAARADFADAVKYAPSLTPAWANLAHACQSAPPRTSTCEQPVWSKLSPAAAIDLAHRDDFTEADLNAVQSGLSPQSMISLVETLDARHVAGVSSMRLLAVAQEQEKNFVGARHTLERIAALDPQNPAHLIELARVADLSHDEEGALGYLAHARDLAPQNPQIDYLFAMIASKMNLVVEARASLLKALALAPQNPDYNYAMGFVLLSTRDAATSASYFQKFVDARPQSLQGHYALGIAYYASGDFTKSKSEMKLAVNNPSTAGGAEYFLGRIARQEQDFDAAKTHLRRSIQLLPAFAESHTELARVLLTENDLSAARTELDRAIALDPASFNANSQLLAIYLRTKDPRAQAQRVRVHQLDEQRSKRAELMLRTIEARPEP